MNVISKELRKVEAKIKLWTLNFILICLSSLVISLAFHSLLPTLPVYIQEHGGSKSMAGLAIAALTVAAVIIRPITGWALDKYGRPIILVIGLGTFLVPYLIYTLMPSVMFLFFLRFIQGFGWGIGSTSQGTVASDIIPANRLGEGLGFFSLANSLSLALAPALGLWLIESFSFQVLFITGSILTIIAMVLSLMIRYPKQPSSTQVSKLVFMEKVALSPALIILLTTVTYSSLLSFLALFAQQQGVSTAGIFFTIVALTTLISRPLAGTVVDKKGQRGYEQIIVTGLIAIIISMSVIAQLTSDIQLIIGGILFGIGFGFVQPAMLALCINKVPAARRGAANATYWTAFDVGVALGSVLWGFVAGYFGYATMFYLNSIPPLIALSFYLLNKKSVMT